MDEQQNYETTTPAPDQPFTVMDKVEGQEVYFGPGAAMTVTAHENVTVSKAGALAITAGQDASVAYGGALAIPVGKDLELVNGGALLMPVGGSASIVNGGAETMIVGGNLDITNGGGLLSFSSQMNAKNSFFGIIISGGTTLEEGSRVLLDTRQAAIFGAAAGVVFAMLSFIFRRRK